MLLTSTQEHTQRLSTSFTIQYFLLCESTVRATLKFAWLFYRERKNFTTIMLVVVVNSKLFAKHMDVYRAGIESLERQRNFHGKQDFCISRKEGGRGLISIEDTTRTSILGLQKYIQESEEKLITAARKAEDISETAKGFKSRRAKESKQNWTDKVLHGQF